MTRRRSQADTNVMDAGQTPTLDSSRRSQGSSASSYSPSVLSSNGEDDLSGQDRYLSQGTTYLDPVSLRLLRELRSDLLGGQLNMNNRQLGRPHRRPVQYHVLTLINPRVPLHPAPNQSSSFTLPTGQPLVNPPLKDPSSVRWQALRDARR